MRLIITGAPGSGKSTFKKETEEVLYQKVPERVVLVESSLQSFFNNFIEFDKVIVVSTNPILCDKRLNVKNFNLEDHQRQDGLLQYIMELPNSIIISNNGTLDEFRVRIKKLLKTL